MKIADAQFTVFDFETTGLYPYSGDRICEIGAIRFARGKIKKRFQALVNPMCPISEAASAINGITDRMVSGCPTIDQVLPDFMDFIKDSVLVAYNAGFDLGFLESALGTGKKALDDYRVIDALRLARRLFPDAGGYSLSNLSKQLGINTEGQHRAMGDAAMTLEVFRLELKALKDSGVSTIEDIVYTRRKAGSGVRKVKDYRLKLIEEAIRLQKKLNIVYRSAWTDSVTQRTIAPKHVQHGYDKTYVVAFCHRSGADRNFRLDGIMDIQIEGGVYDKKR